MPNTSQASANVISQTSVRDVRPSPDKILIKMRARTQSGACHSTSPQDVAVCEAKKDLKLSATQPQPTCSKSNSSVAKVQNESSNTVRSLPQHTATGSRATALSPKFKMRARTQSGACHSTPPQDVAVVEAKKDLKLSATQPQPTCSKSNSSVAKVQNESSNTVRSLPQHTATGSRATALSPKFKMRARTQSGACHSTPPQDVAVVEDKKDLKLSATQPQPTCSKSNSSVAKVQNESSNTVRSLPQHIATGCSSLRGQERPKTKCHTTSTYLQQEQQLCRQSLKCRTFILSSSSEADNVGDSDTGDYKCGFCDVCYYSKPSSLKERTRVSVEQQGSAKTGKLENSPTSYPVRYDSDAWKSEIEPGLTRWEGASVLPASPPQPPLRAVRSSHTPIQPSSSSVFSKQRAYIPVARELRQRKCANIPNLSYQRGHLIYALAIEFIIASAACLYWWRFFAREIILLLDEANCLRRGSDAHVIELPISRKANENSTAEATCDTLTRAADAPTLLRSRRSTGVQCFRCAACTYGTLSGDAIILLVESLYQGSVKVPIIVSLVSNQHIMRYSSVKKPLLSYVGGLGNSIYNVRDDLRVLYVPRPKSNYGDFSEEQNTRETCVGYIPPQRFPTAGHVNLEAITFVLTRERSLEILVCPGDCAPLSLRNDARSVRGETECRPLRAAAPLSDSRREIRVRPVPPPTWAPPPLLVAGIKVASPRRTKRKLQNHAVYFVCKTCHVTISFTKVPIGTRPQSEDVGAGRVAAVQIPPLHLVSCAERSPPAVCSATQLAASTDVHATRPETSAVLASVPWNTNRWAGLSDTEGFCPFRYQKFSQTGVRRCTPERSLLVDFRQRGSRCNARLKPRIAGSDKGDKDRRIKCHIAPMRKAVNGRLVLAYCLCLTEVLSGTCVCNPSGRCGPSVFVVWRVEKQSRIVQGFINVSVCPCNDGLTHVFLLMEGILNISFSADDKLSHCEVSCIIQTNAAMASHSHMIQPMDHTLYDMYYGL
ncbi:hypothetical protein PR048_029619 [Dryococelus australis]|uniref:Uncharacterized protein n=1 Tax=Dryococelus australis TaxID=614101 RepID=A0ABQ9GFX6_9NEOP|nr:hypothetical protein PR048_029619 [Dryococelus australis]